MTFYFSLISSSHFTLYTVHTTTSYVYLHYTHLLLLVDCTIFSEFLSEDFMFWFSEFPFGEIARNILFSSILILFHGLWTSCSIHEFTCHSLIPPSVNSQFYSPLEYYSAHFTEVLFRPTPPTHYVYVVTHQAIHSSVYVTVPWPRGKAQPTSS